jgi:ribosomal protein S18 acetylase RimI-like enzyme
MRLHEIEPEPSETTWNGKHVVQQIGQYRIAVDTRGRATYVTVWTENNKRVGSLSTRGNHLNHYLGIGMADLEKPHRGKGLGLAMYRALLANLDPRWLGIASYLPDRSNLKQVPAIYRRLGGHILKGNTDYMIIPRQQD